MKIDNISGSQTTDLIFLQPYGLVLCGKNPNYTRKGGYILHDKNDVCNKE